MEKRYKYGQQTLLICLLVEVIATIRMVIFFPTSGVYWIENMYKAGIVVGVIGALFIMYLIWRFYQESKSQNQKQNKENES